MLFVALVLAIHSDKGFWQTHSAYMITKNVTYFWRLLSLGEISHTDGCYTKKLFLTVLIASRLPQSPVVYTKDTSLSAKILTLWAVVYHCLESSLQMLHKSLPYKLRAGFQAAPLCDEFNVGNLQQPHTNWLHNIHTTSGCRAAVSCSLGFCD